MRTATFGWVPLRNLERVMGIAWPPTLSFTNKSLSFETGLKIDRQKDT
jgi:hypothetical protein